MHLTVGLQHPQSVTCELLQEMMDRVFLQFSKEIFNTCAIYLGAFYQEEDAQGCSKRLVEGGMERALGQLRVGKLGSSWGPGRWKGCCGGGEAKPQLLPPKTFAARQCWEMLFLPRGLCIPPGDLPYLQPGSGHLGPSRNGSQLGFCFCCCTGYNLCRELHQGSFN